MKKLILAIVILVAFGTGSIAGKAGKKHEIMNKYGQSVGSVQRDIYGNQQFQNKYGLLNLELNGLFFSDYLGQACFFPRCLDRAGQPGSVFSG